MKKLFIIMILFLITNISYSQLHIGPTILAKDSSGTLVFNAPIKTNTSTGWIVPKNISSTVAGDGLSLSVSSGLKINFGDGLMIVDDTVVTVDGLIDTTHFGRLIGNQTWSGNNTFSNANIFYGLQVFDSISATGITATNITSLLPIYSYSDIYALENYKIGDDGSSITVIDEDGNVYANYLTVDSITTDGGIIYVEGDMTLSSALEASTLTTTGVAQVGSLYSSGEITTESATINFYDIKLYVGSGSPNGVKTADIGSLYLRTDGGANTTLYVKESGAGNTGWVAK